MKFLCIPCDEKMETQVEGIMPEEKKNLAMKFKCKKCGHSIAMLTNKFETEFVSKLGVQMGGTAAEATAAPMGVMAGALAEGKDELKRELQPKKMSNGQKKLNNAFKKYLSLYVIWQKKLCSTLPRKKALPS